jgi:hypothetical protein
MEPNTIGPSLGGRVVRDEDYQSVSMIFGLDKM